MMARIAAAVACAGMCNAAFPDGQPDPKAYMVVDLAPGSAVRVAYYPSAEALPGGLTSNDAYRTSMIVMRKIRAKGISWSMGPFADGYVRHVALDADYYIGVFEVTQGQAAMVGGTKTPSPYAMDGARRPLTSASFRDLRDGASGAALYPASPAADSLIGRLRARTGIAFDLPGEAQWEYACRAGYGNDCWNDGALISLSHVDPNLPGRYAWNTRHPGQSKGDAPPDEDRTAVVGSYAPNAWGLYDMHGNVGEFCLDWWTDNPADSAPGGCYTGKVNANGLALADGAPPPHRWRVFRGGAFDTAANGCTSWSRNRDADTGRSCRVGLRLACPAQ